MQNRVIIQLLVLFCGTGTVLVGLKSTGISVSTASPVSSSPTEVPTVTSSAINRLLIDPCATGVIPSTPPTCSNNFTIDDFSRTYRVTGFLKRSVQKLNKEFKKGRSSYCGHEEGKNLIRENLLSFCPIPKPMTSRNSDDLYKNLLLITKWLFWIKEVEYHIYETPELNSLSNGSYRNDAYAAANYSRLGLCSVKDSVCFQSSDIQEVMTCSLPSIGRITDPADLVVPSCIVLDDINKFVAKLYRPLCRLNGHHSVCKKKRAVKKPRRKKRCRGKKGGKKRQGRKRCKKSKNRKNKTKRNKNSRKKQRRQKTKNSMT